MNTFKITEAKDNKITVEWDVKGVKTTDTLDARLVNADLETELNRQLEIMVVEKEREMANATEIPAMVSAIALKGVVVEMKSRQVAVEPEVIEAPVEDIAVGK